ncbi:MAG: hypothetical protein AB1656_10695 [Candidatus Omnitrophota bacterium]
MPHVIFKGEISLKDWCESFNPFQEENKNWLIKIEDAYCESKGRRAILPVVVVEEGHSQSFYLKLSMNEALRQITVKLDPATDPIKTRGVKRSVALVAEKILDRYKHIAIDRHNLKDFLKTPEEANI